MANSCVSVELQHTQNIPPLQFVLFFTGQFKVEDLASAGDALTYCCVFSGGTPRGPSPPQGHCP